MESEKGRKALCLNSGRGGCDAQMEALARGAGLEPVHDRHGNDIRIVITTGSENAEEALRIARSRRIPCIGMGDPGMLGAHMDLVLPTPQFPIADAGNVHRLDLAIDPHGSVSEMRVPHWAAKMQEVGLLLVGGSAGPWRLDAQSIVDEAMRMTSSCSHLVVLTSRRTDDDVRNALMGIAGPTTFIDVIDGEPIRYRDALGAASWAMVTGDSVSMMSECIQAGIPTGAVALDSTLEGVADYLRERPGRHDLTMPGDLPAFWRRIARDGPLDTPAPRSFRDPIRQAVGALHRVMAVH